MSPVTVFDRLLPLTVVLTTFLVNFSSVEGFLYLRLFAVRCKGNHAHCGHIHAGDSVVAALFFGFGQDIPAAVLVLVCEQVVHHALAGVLLNVDKRENEIVGGEPDEGEETPEKKPRDLER